MYAEPYKIKEVKKLAILPPYERWNILKRARFNTFHVSSDHITFDMVEKGMSSWSHFQKAAYMIGDEAYAGSRNYIHLQKAAREVLGIAQLVPTHNRIGAEKLLCTTMLEKGRTIFHNRGKSSALAEEIGARQVDITAAKAGEYVSCDQFGADVDLDRLTSAIEKEEAGVVAFVHVETCPDEWNAQPVSLENLRATKGIVSAKGVPLVIDISNVLENAWWNRRVEAPDTPLIDIVREITSLADIVILDASQAPRADVGGLISSPDDKIFEKFRNQVVVYEGLHTYGGMTGRAMEVFAVGIEEMDRVELVEWYARQLTEFHGMLAEMAVPAYLGGKGIALDVKTFLPQLSPEENPKFALAASLYIHGGIRGRIDGQWADHTSVDGQMLLLDLPRSAFTVNQLSAIAGVISDIYRNREEITGLKLLNEPEFVDEAEFEPSHMRLFVEFTKRGERLPAAFEPYKIAITEPIRMMEKAHRTEAIKRAGYNTFLLDSEEVYIDLLTDSGTSAMSCHQWEGMTDSSDTPYSSRHYLSLVAEFGDILGYNYIIPTHQGRAAEHIMSQVMIAPGQSVPGNMYFTTTRLHQEMAGGVFADVIVDAAHDSQDPFVWKGNIDIEKLTAEIERVGADNIAYVSFEMSVNMAGGQPFSMDNVREVSKICAHHGIAIMFDATRCVENAYMIQKKDPDYTHLSVREILREMLSYGDGCTVSCKKDFLVNMGGLLACNSTRLYKDFNRMLRIWEGDVTNGGMDAKDMEALHRGLLDSLDDNYIRMRVEQTQQFGEKLVAAGVPIVMPPGSHAIFIDARRFLPHLDQEEYPAQALAAAIYMETGVRTMERGNVSKGRDPKTGENFRPALELVRCTIPRRVYTNSHIDYVVAGIRSLYEKRDAISGLEFVYEPAVLRFFQGRFKPKSDWNL